MITYSTRSRDDRLCSLAWHQSFVFSPAHWPFLGLDSTWSQLLRHRSFHLFWVYDYIAVYISARNYICWHSNRCVCSTRAIIQSMRCKLVSRTTSVSNILCIINRAFGYKFLAIFNRKTRMMICLCVSITMDRTLRNILGFGTFMTGACIDLLQYFHLSFCVIILFQYSFRVITIIWWALFRSMLFSRRVRIWTFLRIPTIPKRSIRWNRMSLCVEIPVFVHFLYLRLNELVVLLLQAH